MKSNGGSRWILAMAGLMAVTAAGACSSPSDIEERPGRIAQSDNLQVEEDEDIHVLTQLKDMEVYPEALYRGGLHVDGDGCIRLTEGAGQTTVLWPAGFTVDRRGDDIEVIDAQGSVAGNLEQEFEMAGGELPYLHESLGFTQEDQELAFSRCPGNFWLVTPGTVTTH